MANAREQIISSGGEPTLGEVVELAAKTRPDLPEAAIHRVATEILAGQPDSTGTAVREAIHREMAKRLRIDPMVKKAMAEAFAVVLEEFRDATLKDSAVLESVGRQVHGVTGGQMREFAQRLRDAAPRPLTVEQILAWADLHKERTGRSPNTDSGPVTDAPGEIWGNIDAALREGRRSLPGASSLARILAEHRGVRNKQDLPTLTTNQILVWADAHFQRTEQWPTRESGPVIDCPSETWVNIDQVLRKGLRGLSGGSSLAQVLDEHRGVRNPKDLMPLTVEQILVWADVHHDQTGQWPRKGSGSIANAPGEFWTNVDNALFQGIRGLPGGSSLSQLLAEHRGVRNIGGLPILTKEQILEWADSHRERTGKWPGIGSGPIEEAPGETWANVDAALREGRRGLPGGSSLPRLLAELRGARNIQGLPALTDNQVLAWADAHFERTEQWPTRESGPVVDCPGETWANIDRAITNGLRSFSGDSSLARLLAEHRGVRNHKALMPLTVEQILVWVDAYLDHIGQWPRKRSGPIANAPGETWANVDAALRAGTRGLPGGSSLPRLLAEHRGARNKQDLPILTENQILAWADVHFERKRQWPRMGSGRIVDAPGETWINVDAALKSGTRGLPGGSSLARLLAEERGVRNISALPSLTKDQILNWADAHFESTGDWPKTDSGPILCAPGEKWANINAALAQGCRGLSGGSSLARLLAEERGVRNISTLPLLTGDQILAWAEAHFGRTGHWPQTVSGAVVDAPGEKWANINQALAIGLRGLPGGSSLARLIKEHRGTSD